MNVRRSPDTSGFGSTGTRSVVVMYLGAAVLVALLLNFLFGLGAGLVGGESASVGQDGGASGEGAGHVLGHLLFAVIVIIVAARLMGRLAIRLRQPAVVGEIVAGIVLGPSLLGAAWPEATSFLFPADVMPHLDVLANIGLIFFMFLIGVELDARLLKGRGHAAVWVSHASIVVPFVSGVGLALLIFPILGESEVAFLPFALFMGAAMAVTAFPVLARILTERGLYKSKLGAVALTCAAVDDVTAWSILAVVVTVTQATGPAGAAATIVLSIAFILVMLLVVRPLLERLADYHAQRGSLGPGILTGIFAGVLASALITDLIGIHVIFGAFLAGAVIPNRAEFIDEIVEKLHDFSVLLLLPIFFTFSGLRTEIGLLTSVELWVYALAILVVAVAGKWGGSAVAGRMVGLGWRESSALGVLMNCRGLTELIILNIGLELGVLPPALFAMLVIMAVTTTIMTEPLLALHYPRDEQGRMGDATSEPSESAPATPPVVLVAVGNPATESDLVEAACVIADSRSGHPAEVVLLRIVELPASAYRMGPELQDAEAERAQMELEGLADEVRLFGLNVRMELRISSMIGDTIVDVASDVRASVVILGYHRAVFGERLLGGTVGVVLREAKADVVVVVTEPGRSLALGDISEIVAYRGADEQGRVSDHLAAALSVRLGIALTVTEPDQNAELTARDPRALAVVGLDDRLRTTWSDSPPPIQERLHTPLLIVRASSGYLAAGSSVSVNPELVAE